MYIDLEITGIINGSSNLKFNTKSDNSNGEAKLETVLKAELSAGIEATFVAVGTVKFGIFKRTYSYTDEAIFVEPDKIDFEKNYI